MNFTDNKENAESWAGWAWSYVSSVLPAPWEDDWQQDEHNNPAGHTLHTGFYVDTATVTFKVLKTQKLSFLFYFHICNMIFRYPKHGQSEAGIIHKKRPGTILYCV